MQMETQSNITNLLGCEFTNVIVLKKGLDAKIWKLNEFQYSGTINENDEYDGYGTIKYHINNTPLELSEKQEVQIVKYEGNFTNGHKNGKGKETYNNDDIYIGNFKNNLRDGSGILYSKDGTIKYSGQWSNNETINTIIYYERDNKNNKKTYYGSFKTGKYDGLGVLFDSNENIIQIGEYVQGKAIKSLDFKNNPQSNKPQLFRTTKNIVNSLDTIYDAIKSPLDINNLEKIKHNLLDVNYDGEILLFNEYGHIIYEGNMKNNRFEGNGIYRTLIPNSNNINCIPQFEFEGKFADDCFIAGTIKSRVDGNDMHLMYSGSYVKEISVMKNMILEYILQYLNEGIYYYSTWNGINKFEGKFVNSRFSKGIITNNEQKIYEGSFSLDERIVSVGQDYNMYNGSGTEYYTNGSKKYEGEYKNGKYHGIGTSYHENGTQEYFGSFSMGDRHGNGMLFGNNGDLVYEGNFQYNNIN